MNQVCVFDVRRKIEIAFVKVREHMTKYAANTIESNQNNDLHYLFQITPFKILALFMIILFS